MAVTVYKSTDASAPVLTGLGGSLLGVLNGCLNTGYGAKPAAGWSKPFADSANKGCFKSAGSNIVQVALDDSAHFTVSVGREAEMRGYEALTSATAGTGPYPTVAQVGGNGLVFRKSQTADATAVPWIVVSDDRTCYVFIDTPDFTGWSGFMFGEYFSLKGSGDLFRTMIVGRLNSVANGAIALDSDDNLQKLYGDAVTVASTTGHFAPRNPSGDVQAAMALGKHGDGIKGTNQLLISTNRIGNGTVTYPNQTDGSIMLSNVWVHDVEGNMNVRGRMRGFWQFLHPIGSPVNNGDTFSGTGALAGKTFLVIRPVASGDGLYVMETSNTWETN